MLTTSTARGMRKGRRNMGPELPDVLDEFCPCATHSVNEDAQTKGVAIQVPGPSRYMTGCFDKRKSRNRGVQALAHTAATSGRASCRIRRLPPAGWR